MPSSILQARQHYTVLQGQHLTSRYYTAEKLVFNEWRGVVPTEVLRKYTLSICHFLLDYEVELMLVDYSRMTVPSLADQLWIINHSEKLLRQSKLLRMASVHSPELFQPLDLPIPEELHSTFHLPCVFRDFAHKEDALHWLMT